MFFIVAVLGTVKDAFLQFLFLSKIIEDWLRWSSKMDQKGER